MHAATLGAYRADVTQLISNFNTAERPNLRVVPNNTALRLNANWIDDILALQAVSADGQTILRNREYLEDFFAQGKDCIFGIVDENGRLIGQATTKMDVTLPSILKQSFDETQEERHAIIGCVTVHPDARGQGLMAQLITLCLDEARTRGMTNTHARVKLGNEASLKNFLKFGFNIAATGPSPEDKTRVVDFLHLKM